MSGDVENARSAFTIAEFCGRNAIGLATFHKLKRQGLGPREMRLGSAIRISIEAERDWRNARENPGPQEAKELAAQATDRRERARAAGKLAAQSPRHISTKRAQKA
jgi:hypothetical protein